MSVVLCECIGGPLDGEILPFTEIRTKKFSGGVYWYQIHLRDGSPALVDNAVDQLHTMTWVPTYNA